MSFYLKPPRGETNLHVLLECSQQRMNCYKNLENNSDIVTVGHLEYLNEDSILDRTSHFIFRLGVLTGAISKAIFVENELKLFEKRVECYQKQNYEFFLKKILRQLKDCIRMNIGKDLSDFYWTLYNIICEMLRKEYLYHVMNKTCDNSDSCDKFRISVPFWYCNKLVAAREVDLKNGNAIFDCGQWREILPNLFISYLNIVLAEMMFSENVRNALSDDRLKACIKIIRNYYSSSGDSPVKNAVLRLKDLNDEMIKFPMCMRNLFEELKTNHRLEHNDRFDLSVFLRGVGLSLSDSVKFWQGEYSQKHSTCSKCTHSWQDSEKKYIYGLRHLYGLEGSRRTYAMKSCTSLQGVGLGLSCKGGCPFVHYDDEFLRSALKKYLPNFDDEVEIMIFERKENAKLACKLYSNCILKMINKTDSEKVMKFEDPVRFYKNFRRL